MSIDEISLRESDNIPVGKALVCENLSDNVFIVTIGKRYHGSEVISHTMVTIPKNNNLLTDAQRIGATLLKYNVVPMFNVKEYLSGGKKVIGKISE